MASKFLESLLSLLLILLSTNSVNSEVFPSSDIPPAFSGKDVTRLLFDKSVNVDLYPVAFGDFNADKLTDIIATNRTQSGITLLLAQSEEPLFKPTMECELKTAGKPGEEPVPMKIVGVNLADFNGDGLMDILVTYIQAGVHNRSEVRVFAGNGTEFNCGDEKAPLQQGIEVMDEPLIIDVDGDMIMDFLAVQYKTNKTMLWKFRQTRNPAASEFDVFEIQFNRPDDVVNILANPAEYRKSEMATPNINSFVDVDGDTVPELVIVSNFNNEGGQNYYFVSYYRIGVQKDEKFWQADLIQAIELDKPGSGLSSPIFGQSVFLDMNQDGNLLHILPGCSSKACKDPLLLSVSTAWSNATKLNVNFNAIGMNWVFDTTHTPWFEPYKENIILRVGDYNMDGYPDLIGVLATELYEYTNAKKEHRAVIFENIPCVPANPSDTSCIYPRTFRLDVDSLAEYHNVDMATFFDIYDDGLLDVLLVRRTTDNNEVMDKHACFGFLSNPDYDANFLKVVVTTGKECPLCPLDGIPYGSVIPGPVVRYNSTTQTGTPKTSVAAQFYRSAHFPLDLPYTFFGIGHSPNFIDVLEVSVSHQSKLKKSKKWTQLIPNSQIIVIPYLPDESWWKAKIFLPSSKAALHTFGVLLGFCGFIASIVVMLHWKERREDRQERLAESHRFHMM